VEGAWPPPESGTEDAIARVSIEADIAEELNVEIGDRISWDIQGVPVETEIVNIRRVDWVRFEPNFFFVFESGVLDDAPQSLLMLSRIDDPIARAELQRDIVKDHPNVATIDITVIINAIDAILSKVALAIRFMALFSIGAGIVILIGAIATSRYQRARESVLLKTLGARSRIIARILATEYFALGSFAGLAGVALAAIGGWAAIVFLFKMNFHLPALPLIGIWIATAALTTAIGMANSRDVMRRTPLAGMRDFAE
jgi:putative ABC transport system permease protein